MAGRAKELTLMAVSIVLTAAMIAGIAMYRAGTGEEQALIPWGMMVVAYVFFAIMSGGIADSTLIAAFALKDPVTRKMFRRNIYAALAVLVPGIILVFSDILHPSNSYWFYLGFNPKSRIAWNAILYLLYAVSLILLLVASIRGGEEYLEKRGVKYLALATFVISINLEMNLGMAFGSNIAVSTWYSVYSGMLFIASAFALGAAWLMLTGGIRRLDILSEDEKAHEDKHLAVELGLAVATVGFVVLWGTLGLYSWGLTYEFVRELVTGKYAAFFWIGYVIPGLVLPLILAKLVADGKVRISPLVGILTLFGILVLLAVPYTYAGQEYRLMTNELYENLAEGIGGPEVVSLKHYIASSETLAFIGGFGLAILLDLIGARLLPLKPGEKPGRFWIFK